MVEARRGDGLRPVWICPATAVRRTRLAHAEDAEVDRAMAEGRWGLDRSAALVKLRQAGIDPELLWEAAEKYSLGRCRSCSHPARLRWSDRAENGERPEMIVSVAHPEPSPDGGAQLVRNWDPPGVVKADIVLVHGLGEHSGRYARTGSLLAEAGYRVRSFDLLGFGASSGERADIARWSLFLDQVESSLEAMRTAGTPLVLMGHSMGGLIALDYALAERPQPDLLILSAPALGGGKPWQRSLAPHLARLFPTLRMPSLITGDQLSRDPRVGEAYFADPLVLTKTSTRLGASIFACQDRLAGALDSLSIPTLVIHGGQDNLVPTASSEALLSCRGLVRRVFPDLRHETMNEPEGPAVVAEIIDWIETNTA